MESLVRIEQGKLEGRWETTVYGKKFLAFRGVPYAAPPLGDRRFKDPEPPQAWSGVRRAVEFGRKCVQMDWLTRKIVGDEDCLYLNVYTPSLTTSPPRAVMFWIHGGGFVSGSGEDDLYGPDYLLEHDVVLVTINYRLGVFGFLNVGDEIAAGNQGLKDQVFALRWVEKNISQFGGDPKNVTIFGESAGSASVHYLTLSPLAEGLFHKAIMQSGVAINSWASIARDSSDSAQKLAVLLGKEEKDPKKLVEFLQTVDTQSLVRAEYANSTNEQKMHFMHPFLPSVDVKSKNPFLTIPVSQAAKQGVKVPCLIGYTKDEGILLFATAEYKEEMFNHVNEDSENFLLHPTIKKYLQGKNVSVSDVRKRYFGDEDISINNPHRMIHLMGDTMIVLGIDEFLEIQLKSKNHPTYLYKFDCEMDYSIFQKIFRINFPGVCHGDELSCLFYHKVAPLFGKTFPARGSDDYRAVQRLTELWTTFAKTGNPTPKVTAFNPFIWKPIDNPDLFNCLNFSKTPKMTCEKPLLEYFEKCKKSDE